MLCARTRVARRAAGSRRCSFFPRAFFPREEVEGARVGAELGDRARRREARGRRLLAAPLHPRGSARGDTRCVDHLLARRAAQLAHGVLHRLLLRGERLRRRRHLGKRTLQLLVSRVHPVRRLEVLGRLGEPPLLRLGGAEPRLDLVEKVGILERCKVVLLDRLRRPRQLSEQPAEAKRRPAVLGCRRRRAAEGRLRLLELVERRVRDAEVEQHLRTRSGARWRALIV